MICYVWARTQQCAPTQSMLGFHVGPCCLTGKPRPGLLPNPTNAARRHQPGHRASGPASAAWPSSAAFSGLHTSLLLRGHQPRRCPNCWDLTRCDLGSSIKGPGPTP